ncbi:type VI secretion system-associated protein TagO [Falsiroseomonas sp.]|uniref:type VI secretion system-associated protein TagO n=1 Tax=Falsiroseomonas sp. TaxID=2870721 RepID=UPI003F71DF71
MIRLLALLATTVALTSASIPALADSLPNCREIVDPAERLACFDQAPIPGVTPAPTETSTAAPTTEPVVQPATTTRWQVRVQRDLMGGPNRAFVTQTASEFTGAADRSPVLTLRCGVEDNKLEVIYNPQIYLGRPVSSSESSSIKVRIRLDSRAPYEQSWGPSTSRNVAFASDPRRFYETLLRHRTLVIEAEAHGTRVKVAAEFDLEGLADLASALEGCLPPLPMPEITREHGIGADLIDFVSQWRVLPRANSGPSANQRMLVLYGHISTETGNQDTLFFWCEGSNLVGHIRFDAPVPRQLTRLRLYGIGRSSSQSYANPRKINDRTVALTDPRAFARAVAPGSPRNFVLATADGQDDLQTAGFLLPALDTEQAAVIAPCLNPPRQQQPSSSGR